MDYTNYLSSTKSDNFPLRGKVGQLSKKKRVLCWSNYIISLWFGDTWSLLVEMNSYIFHFCPQLSPEPELALRRPTEGEESPEASLSCPQNIKIVL